MSDKSTKSTPKDKAETEVDAPKELKPYFVPEFGVTIEAETPEQAVELAKKGAK